MYAAWHGRATGPMSAYAMVEQVPLAKPLPDEDSDTEAPFDGSDAEAPFDSDSDGCLGPPCQRQAWLPWRTAGLALVATVVIGVLALPSMRRFPKRAPSMQWEGWQVGGGRPRYSVKDEEQFFNPYALHLFYQSPLKKAQFSTSIASSDGLVRDRLEAMREVATAVWIDRKAMIRGSSLSSVDGILKDASWKVTAQLVTLVMHNLPNRDCSDQASRPEICCRRLEDGSCDLESQGGLCKEGLREYREEYVDPLVQVLQKHEGAVPVVVILEPGALPSLVANGGSQRCAGAATSHAYREGLRYAAEQLAEKTPWVTIYLDAAHGGLLGWRELVVRYLRTLKELQLPLTNIRGFATNIAGYRPLGKAACPWVPVNGSNGYCLHGGEGDPCCEDPCGFLETGNFANSELNYAQELVHGAKELLDVDVHVITDSSRNGQADLQTVCSSRSCNVRKAGSGRASTAKVHPSAASFLDAYFWIKTPGESDGCARLLPSGKECLRYDERCASEDSLGSRPHEEQPPEAGEWFDYQAKELAGLSDLGLDEEAQALQSMRAQEKDVQIAHWR